MTQTSQTIAYSGGPLDGQAAPRRARMRQYLAADGSPLPAMTGLAIVGNALASRDPEWRPSRTRTAGRGCYVRDGAGYRWVAIPAGTVDPASVDLATLEAVSAALRASHGSAVFQAADACAGPSGAILEAARPGYVRRPDATGCYLRDHAGVTAGGLRITEVPGAWRGRFRVIMDERPWEEGLPWDGSDPLGDFLRDAGQILPASFRTVDGTQATALLAVWEREPGHTEAVAGTIALGKAIRARGVPRRASARGVFYGFRLHSTTTGARGWF